MTLPTSNISMSNVDVELNLAATATLSLNDSGPRTLAVKPSVNSTISMLDLEGKASYKPTLREYSQNTGYSPGVSYSITIPAGVTSIAILMVGGGGGGGSSNASSNKWDGGGGGGGGGVVYVPSFPVGPGQILKLTFGAGGTGGINTAGLSGGNSTIIDNNTTTYYIAPGGGGGGGGDWNNPTVATANGRTGNARSGLPGGSGGGATGTDYNIQGAPGGVGFYTYPGFTASIYGNSGGSAMNNGFNGGGGGAGTTTNNTNTVSIAVNTGVIPGSNPVVSPWSYTTSSVPYTVLVNNNLLNPWAPVNNGGQTNFKSYTGNPPSDISLTALNGAGQGQNGYISGYGTTGYIGLGFSGAGGDGITINIGGTNVTMGAGGGGGGSYEMGGSSVQTAYCPANGGQGPGGKGGGGAGGGGGSSYGASPGSGATGYGSGGGGGGGRYPATIAAGGSGSPGAIFLYY